MRDLLLNTHVRLEGEQRVAASFLPFARTLLGNLIQHTQASAITHATWVRTISGPITGGSAIRVEVRVAGDQRYIIIRAAAGCRDRDGFLLTKENENYDARYNDGFIERINPINGTPRPDPDPATRTRGYKVPDELRVAEDARPSASKFTGLMRLAVGCYHSRGLDAPFSYTFAKTHGVLKIDVPVGNPPEPRTRYFVIEISASGVFAAPIDNTGNCCDSWGISRYVPTDEEIAEQPSLEQFKTTLSLNWAFSVGRQGVVELLTAGDVAVAFTSGFPWYGDCGWAFSASGVTAQNVVQTEVGAAALRRFLCSRFQFSFALDFNNNLTAALAIAEFQQVAQFPAFSGVFQPIAAHTWLKTQGLTAGQLPLTTFINQNAPIHVYYDGETAIVTRWTMAISNQVGGLVGCTSGQTRQFLGGQLHCANFIQAHSLNTCYHFASGGPHTFTPQPPPPPPHPDDDPRFIHQGSYTYGGMTQIVGAHFRVIAGFTSPVFSSVRERSSKSIDRFDTQQGADILTVVDSPTNYTLDSACHYVAICGGFPGTPVLVSFAPLTQRTTTKKAPVWNNRTTGTEALAARTVFVPFLNEREAGLNILHATSTIVGSQFQEGISSVGFYIGHISVKKESVGQLGSGICSASQLSNPAFPTNEFADQPGAIDFGGTIDTTVFPVNSTATEATAQLNAGSVAASTSALFGTLPGQFLFLLFSVEPADLSVASPIFAQHGNLYYDDPSLEPPNQAGNAVYLLEAGVPVTTGGFNSEALLDVVGFVGKS